jgi:hypothetical protein
LLENSKRV